MAKSLETKQFLEEEATKLLRSFINSLTSSLEYKKSLYEPKGTLT
jgi:hypothetical protein